MSEPELGMSNHQSVQARSYSALLSPAREFLREWSGKGEVLVLSSVRESADELVRSACAPALIGVHRLGWRDFVVAASSRRMGERGLAPVHRLAREALAARVLAAARRQNLLHYLDPVAGCRGTPRALASTLEDLRLNGLTPAALRQRSEAGLPDLAALLELYEAELNGRAYADHPARVALAIDAVRGGSVRFSGMPLVLIDVEPGTALERSLLENLIDRSPAVYRGRLAESAPDAASALSSLQHYLFSGETAPDRAPDATFQQFAASSEAIECVEIARRILRLARSGTPFDRIAILLRGPERYQPLVAEALRRAAIPAWFTSGTRRPDPTGLAFLALLRCAEQGLPASTFAEYLSLGQMPAEKIENRQPYRWEQLIVDAAVIGGKTRWERRLQGVIEELELQLEAAQDDGLRTHLERQIQSFRDLAGFALPLISALDSLPRQALWGEWLDALRKLAAAAIEGPDSLYELLESLQPLAEIGPVNLADVLLVLENDLAQHRVQPQDHQYGRVWVGSIEEARGFSFDVVFVPGVNESVFPKPAREDPLLLDRQRQQLGLPSPQDDTELLRLAVACAARTLVMSYSRLDSLNGRQRVPSFFAFEAFKAARGSAVDVGAFKYSVEEAAGARLGWPAPTDPAEAIDDAEFDLATLRPAANTGGSGEGAYLLTANPNAARSLRARYRRWEKKTWSYEDGLIGGTVHDFASFEPYSPRARAYSPSALQQFARCPYRFALRSIIGLQEMHRPVPLQRMDVLTRGQIIHAAQAVLHRRLKEADLLPVDRARLPQAQDHLESVLSELRQSMADQLAPAIDQIWQAEWDAIGADLRGWLQFKSSYESEWIPEFFEWSFGLRDRKERDPSSVAEPVPIEGDYKVSGAVDLIERRSSDGMLRVVDHKTGKVPKDPVFTIGGGEMLQAALYALAVERHFEQPVSGGRLFYSTLRGNYTARDVPLSATTREAVQLLYATLDEHLRNGFLPAAPRQGGCERCEFEPVCGPWEEERVSRKSKKELAGLAELRELR